MRTALRDPRVRLTLLLPATIMAMLSAQRLVLAILMRGRFAEAGLVDLARSFLVGLRFDLVVAAMLTLPLALLVGLTPYRIVTGRIFPHVAAALAALAASAVLFLAIADGFFFAEFTERLNHKALNYLGYSTTYSLIWDEYPVVPGVLATLVLLVAAQWGFRRLAWQRTPAPDSTVRSIVWMVIAIPLLALAIRGTLARKGINTGPAYFTSDTAVVQLALNGPFSLREAVISRLERRQGPDSDLSDEEALAIAVDLIARPRDTLLGHDDNPLRRRTETGRPRVDHNVVVVMLESVSWHYCDALGGVPGLMPNLDRLTREGVSMSRCFAVGTRTSRAFAGILAGYPDLPGRSVTAGSEAEGGFLTLAELLRRRGYHTIYLYAGQGEYDHQQAFMASNGFEELIFEDDFESRTLRTTTGWCDEDLYHEAVRAMSAAPEPFMAAMLTGSFHRPWETPEGRVPGPRPGDEGPPEQLASLRYTDWAIGEFLREAAEHDWFERTLFVFVADHAGGFLEYPRRFHTFRVPFVMYGPGVLGGLAPRVIDVPCSQVDIAPTVLDVLGGTYEHCFFGSSVLDRTAAESHVLVQDHEMVYFMDGERYVAQVRFAAEPRLRRYRPPDRTDRVRDPEQSDRLETLRRRGLALLQAAYVVHDRGSHRVDERPGLRDDLTPADRRARAGE